MGFPFIFDERHRQLQHFRRRTWLLIALCMFARGADAPLGLGLIKPTHQPGVQEVPPCSSNTEHRI